jgi:hypothetical protein
MTCRRAAELITSALDDALPLRHRAGLGFHTLLCGACRRFRAQIAAVDEAVGELLADPALPTGPAWLPAESKEQLKRALREELDRPS